MPNTKCKYCGYSFKYGDFSYNDDTCWDCLCKEISEMKSEITKYSGWKWTNRREHIHMVNYLMRALANQNGLKYDPFI